MPKQRLDTLLAERGLFGSRSSAAASVMAGEVHVGSGRRVAQKPGELIDVDEELDIRGARRFVSRGGIKLDNALKTGSPPVAGRQAMDVGASTGGFTDCLLAHGVAHVIAVDVAYGQLDYRLRQDERVSVLERTNARSIQGGQLPYAPDLGVIDVSFIGLGKVLPAVLGCMADIHDVLALVKPQFEVGPKLVGKGGVVREAATRRLALVGVGEEARALGCAVLGFRSSGLPGPKGNRESFIWLAEGARDGGAASPSELESMVRAVEP